MPRPYQTKSITPSKEQPPSRQFAQPKESEVRCISGKAKVVLAYKRAIKDMISTNSKASDTLGQYVTDIDQMVDHVFNMWISRLSWREYINKTFIQLKLNFD